MSPIKGLSEQLRLPRLGKLHLGIKAQNAQGVEYPKAVDYFVCDPNSTAAADFEKVYGKEPRTLDICFPTDNPEHWASQYYRAYRMSRGLVCRGDGEACERMINAETGEQAIADAQVKKIAWTQLTCPGQECEYYRKKECREIMFLQFLLPRVPGLGLWQVDTGSINSIRAINSAVNLLQGLWKGQVALKLLQLSIVMREVSPEGRKKHVPILQLSVPLALAELRDSPDKLLLLPEADTDTPEMLVLTEEQRRAAAIADEIEHGKPPEATVSPEGQGVPSKPQADAQHGQEAPPTPQPAAQAQAVPPQGKVMTPTEFWLKARELGYDDPTKTELTLGKTVPRWIREGGTYRTALIALQAAQAKGKEG